MTKQMVTEKHNAIITGVLPYIIFPENNNIKFFQDFSFLYNIPSGVKFYPIEAIESSIRFIGDGYGVRTNNEWGLSGTYGNGAIFVDKNKLPSDTVKWCMENFMKK